MALFSACSEIELRMLPPVKARRVSIVSVLLDAAYRAEGCDSVGCLTLRSGRRSLALPTRQAVYWMKMYLATLQEQPLATQFVHALKGGWYSAWQGGSIAHGRNTPHASA